MPITNRDTDEYIGLTSGDLRPITKKKFTIEGITIPKGFEWDGVTAKAPFTFIFSSEDLENGRLASCVHDWMCENKDKYGRKQATSILMKLWKRAGLGNTFLSSWKPWTVYICVELYQMTTGWDCPKIMYIKTKTTAIIKAIKRGLKCQ